ncbi:hypothetical protein BD770DRAFT_409049 [Pilaira anomala]|nr:hypothetical protein BD770DRAFT_409049 [Pilaira anomala]
MCGLYHSANRKLKTIEVLQKVCGITHHVARRVIETSKKNPSVNESGRKTMLLGIFAAFVVLKYRNWNIKNVDYHEYIDAEKFERLFETILPKLAIPIVKNPISSNPDFNETVLSLHNKLKDSLKRISQESLLSVWRISVKCSRKYKKIFDEQDGFSEEDKENEVPETTS